MQKKLYRSRQNVMVCGVCVGIAEYFAIDPTIVRIIWALGSIALGAGFLGLVAYILCAIIIPEDDGVIETEYREKK